MQLNKLRNIIEKLKSVLIAYSGGVDSSFLLKIAVDTLGSQVIAVTRGDELIPSQELARAKEFAQELKIKHLIIDVGEIEDPEFNKNSAERCYVCKRNLFRKLKDFAEEYGLNTIIDGSNFDDLNEHRPGRRALEEFGIRSPLQEAGLKKKDIRLLSKELNLPFWDAGSSGCLATRIPYGDKITRAKLKRINDAELFLENLGLREIRVRDYNTLARIEVAREDRKTILKSSHEIIKEFKKLGYIYVALDLEGYRSGSMEEGGMME